MQAVSGKCRLQVVGGQLLPGAAAHLLLITRASTADSQTIISPLHIFSCHVIKLRDVQAQVIAACLCNTCYPNTLRHVYNQ